MRQLLLNGLNPDSQDERITQMLYKDITEKIIAASMQVHKTLGNGFQELIYQRALEIEMPLQGLSFVREMEMPIWYRHQQIGTRRVDFFVEEKLWLS